MGRHKKFEEESTITSFRVPRSKKEAFRKKINELIEKEANQMKKKEEYISFTPTDAKNNEREALKKQPE